jgi:holo-[acyl-carrier protein] synthase
LIKIGTDICSVKRIAAAYERHGERFLERILTEQERLYVLSQPPHTVARLAGRFAAKEAASKALGTGWHGVGWKEIEVVRQSSGEPKLVLHGRASAIAMRRGLKHWEVSVSHEREFATASVLAYSEESAPGERA